MALLLMGIMGTLLVWVVDAKSQVINITWFNGSTAWQLIQSYTQNWDDLELYFLKSDWTTSHYTIMDRNMWATEPYNKNYNTTTINTASFWYHYQRWNNYGFEPCINTNTCNTFPNSEGTTTTIAQNIWSAYMPSKYARNTWSTSLSWMAWDTNVLKGVNIWWWGEDTYESNQGGTLIGYNNDWRVLSWRQWPCPNNYYIPSTFDWLTIRSAWWDSVLNSSVWSQIASDLLLPPAGYRDHGRTVYRQGTHGYYWSSSNPSDDTTSAPMLVIIWSSISSQNGSYRSDGFSVRCAKSSPNTLTFTLQANGWTKAVVAFTGTVNTWRFTTLWTPVRTDGKAFLWWYSDESFNNRINVWDAVTSNLYAKWQCWNHEHQEWSNCVIDSYTITWKNDDGSTIDTTTVNYGVTPTHTAPTKAATQQYTYTFAGWSPAVVSVTADATYTATYTPNIRSYDVSIVALSSAYGSVSDSSVNANYWTTISTNWNVLTIWSTTVTATEELDTDEWDYSFVNWTFSNCGTVGLEEVRPSCTITANFTRVKKQYSVTFVDEDGETVLKAATAYDYGTPAASIVKPADPTKAATQQYTYTFNGWTPTITEVTEDATYRATYSSIVNSYTATIGVSPVNYGIVSDDSVTADYGTTISVAWNTVTIGETTITAIEATDTDEWDYSFVNWTNSCGAELTGNCTVTANFTRVKKQYNVTFVDEDGTTVLDSQTVAYGETPIYAGETPTKAGDNTYTYTFGWWSPELSSVIWDATYTATYDEHYIEYTITFVNYDGTPVSTSWYHYGDTVVVPSDPRRTDYVFDGWNPAVESTVNGNATYTATWKDDKNNNGTPDEDENPWIVTVHYVYSRGWEASADQTWIYLSGLAFSFTSPAITYYTADVDTVTWTWKDEAQEFTVTYTPINDRNRNWIADEEETLSSWWSGWGWRRILDDNSEKSEQDTEDSQPTEEASAETSEWHGYTQEFIDAYTFAYRNWITTQSPITNADMDWNLTRIAMAKMLSKFSINVVWMKPDETRINKFNDVSDELDEQYDNWVTLAYQLGIMWINMPNNEFRPFDLVTRWEFATALSRILWWDKYNVLDTNNMPFYQKHIDALKKEWIITQINPTMNELRWYVMLMLLRSNTFN